MSPAESPTHPAQSKTRRSKAAPPDDSPSSANRNKVRFPSRSTPGHCEKSTNQNRTATPKSPAHPPENVFHPDAIPEAAPPALPAWHPPGSVFPPDSQTESFPAPHRADSAAPQHCYSRSANSSPQNPP